MSQETIEIKVFISCPSDVEYEKDIAVRTCESISRMLAKEKIAVKTIHWRKDVLPIITGEGPQKIIDKHLEGTEYDIYIGILWKKFGELQENGKTPTEGEFEDALLRYKQTWKPLITVFFKEKECLFHNQHETLQYLEVQKFREKIKSHELGIYNTFTTELDFQEKVYETIHEFVKRLISIKDDEIHVDRVQYKEVQNYLNRKVCPISEYKAERFFLPTDETNIDTLELIKDQKRLVIVGDAGTGKTCELQRIASHFSKKDSPYFPYWVSLNKYVDQNIEQFLPANWEQVPDNQLLAILDGIDEIESKNKRDAIRKIELFSEQHPGAAIIVSCRSNFYQFETDKSFGTLKGFKTYILLPLDFPQIEHYTQSNLKNKSTDFINSVKIDQLYDLLRIPFYLIVLVDLFRKTGKLPESKASIFEKLFKSRIELDESHFRTTIEIEEYRNLIIRTLEKIALSAETLGRNYVTDEEFKKLIPDLNLRKLLMHCTAFRKIEGELTTWQFEHNNIQEFLAAKVLSRQPIELIKSFVSFKPDHKKIIPSWINAVSFLLSISPDQTLIDWILEIEPEISVKFEPDKIDEVTRVKIFKRIFNEHKKKRIWIDRDKFRYDELARFGQSEEIVEFLLKEAEHAEHYTVLSNAIEMLAQMHIPTPYQRTTTNILLRTALDRLDIQISEQVQKYALMALSDLNFHAKEIIEQVVEALGNSQSDWVRYGLYYFLHNSEYLDDYIDIFIDGIKFARFHVSDFSYRHSRLANERSELIIGLKKAVSPNSIAKIINYFLSNYQDVKDLFMGNHDVTFLATNAAKAYEKDQKIFDLSVELSLVLLKQHLKDEAKQFITFFDRTDTRFEAFKKVLNIKSHYKEEMLADLSDDQCLSHIINQYENNIINEEEVWRFLYALRWQNKDLFQSFYGLINEKFNNKFKLRTEPDWDKIRKERTQKDFDLLFDKNSFINEIKNIFEQEDKPSFTSKDLLNLRTDNWPNLNYSNIAADTLRRVAGNNSVTLQQAIDIINKYDWDWFAITHIYNKLRNNKDIHVAIEQEKWISTWCSSRLAEVDFNTAIIKTREKSWSIRWDAIYLWYFFRRFALTYPKALLLDMLSFDYDREGIEYLENHIDMKDITERILENLEKGIEIDDTLINHIDYCKRNKTKSGLLYALREIRNPERDSEIRHISLQAALVLSEDLSDLEQILIDINDPFKWDIVDELIKKNPKKVVNFLSETFKKDEFEDKIKAATYLIRFQDLDALRYYVDWIKGQQKYDHSLFYSSSLNFLKTDEALPLLIELLEVTYQDNFEQTDDFERLERLVLDAIKSIGLESEGNYLKARNEIEDFIQRYLNVYKNINWLYAFLNQLEHQYYVNKSEKLEIDAVLAKIEDINSS